MGWKGLEGGGWGWKGVCGQRCVGGWNGYVVVLCKVHHFFVNYRHTGRMGSCCMCGKTCLHNIHGKNTFKTVPSKLPSTTLLLSLYISMDSTMMPGSSDCSLLLNVVFPLPDAPAKPTCIGGVVKGGSNVCVWGVVCVRPCTCMCVYDRVQVYVQVYVRI